MKFKHGEKLYAVMNYHPYYSVDYVEIINLLDPMELKYDISKQPTYKAKVFQRIFIEKDKDIIQKSNGWMFCYERDLYYTLEDAKTRIEELILLKM